MKRKLPKQKSRKSLCAKADRLWSQLILSKGKCEVCGKPATNPHHIIGRRNLTLRHDPRNGCALCALHHTFGTASAHQDPVWFMYFLMEHRPDDYNYLIEKREVLTHSPNYEAIIKQLSGLLDGGKD